MRIKVEYNNKVLGNGTFWSGDEKYIQNIKNIPARMLAKEVIKDGVTRESGMWKVFKI